MVNQDEKYMQMALKLARHGVGSVEPNPAVGVIIVKANQIIGKGWHKKFGGPHAEINALQDCKTLGVNPRGATMYVTLEPCCHQGKTGPCTEAIIAAGVAKVFVATIDPSEHARGKGIEQLRNAGIQVETGVCETEAKLINAPFIKFASTGNCWVILKWAQSIDGKLAWAKKSDPAPIDRSMAVSPKSSATNGLGSSIGAGWISNEVSRRDVQRLRRRAGAVLVGINTVIADDPLLIPRPSTGKKITRIVLDTYLRIPLECKLLATTKDSPVLILAGEPSVQANQQIVQVITEKGAEVLAYPEIPGRSNLYFLLDELRKRGIAQLLVEGGPTVIGSFLKEQLADEICIYISPRILGQEGAADIARPMAELAASFGLFCVEAKLFGDDVRLRGFSEKTLKELSILGGYDYEKDRSSGSADYTGNQGGGQSA
jgi:diaminohydroxyphosphoribosylaminopyrimidine deaminase/5-amino-6-(5-phosphoribosylamino)uracil reductase